MKLAKALWLSCSTFLRHCWDTLLVQLHGLNRQQMRIEEAIDVVQTFGDVSANENSDKAAPIYECHYVKCWEGEVPTTYLCCSR